MNVAEFKTWMEAFTKTVGPKAKIFLSVTGDPVYRSEEIASLSLYPSGMTGGIDDRTIRVRGNDFDELRERMTVAWIEQRDAVVEETIQKIALAIIDNSFRDGSCKAAALRVLFGEEDVATYGKEAVERADALASRGPFSIVEDGPSNGAPSTVAEEDADADRF